MSDVKLFVGDCLEVLKGIESHSVDAVITDPPYYNVVNCEWDKQWSTLQEYICWLSFVVDELKRVLKDNGSLYIFCDDKTAAYIQVELDKKLLLLNNLVWFKVNNLPIKNAHNLRSYAPMTERILFYTCQYDPTGWDTVRLDVNNFLPLRDYFREYQHALGLSIKQINDKLGHRKAEHAFYWNSTQWSLPTEETYKELKSLKTNNGFVRRDYEDLRRDYEDLRRTFNADSETLDVISGPIITQSENTAHPTTKPLWILERFISVSSNPGDLILDPLCGSGSTGVAAVKLGRDFIGIDKEAEYIEISQRRIDEELVKVRQLELEL